MADHRSEFDGPPAAPIFSGDFSNPKEYADAMWEDQLKRRVVKDGNRHPNSARFHELLERAGEMHDRKQQDYGRGDDPFANVRASDEWGIPGWVGAMVRAQDKLRRLQAHATRGSLVNESVEDSLLDLAVYALIALVLYEQEQ